MEQNFKMGSLFDGSGGFPLASTLCGIEPVWAAEIEPFPIKVTKKRFPNMKHYGDISQIDVSELETVDLISGGSPCQSLSIAGKRDGMSKKCPNCDYKVIGNSEETECPECGAELEYTRSGLFMEQIRIVKEMRKKDELGQLQSGRTAEYIRPRFMLWENVTGAFSSNKGEDFRAVLEETAKIVDKQATIPRPEKGKWSNAGLIVGDGYSIAWRVLDAQYWGVPQRRRRIALVADFAGECAGEILFKRDGLHRNFTESSKAWKGTPGDFTESIREASEPFCYNGENLTSPVNKQNPQPGDPCHTLSTDPRNYLMQPLSAGFCTEHSAQSRGIGYEEEKSPTLRAGVVPACLTQDPQYSVDFGRTADRIQMNADKAVTLLGEGGGGGAKTGLYCLPKEPMVMNERQYACTISEGIANTLTGTDYKGTQCVFEPKKREDLYCMATQQGGAEIMNDKAPTITAAAGMSGNNQPVVNQPVKVYGISSYASNAMLSSNPHSGIYEADTSRTLDLNGGNPACNQGGMMVCEPKAFSLQGNMIGREDHNGPQGSGVNEDVSFTLNATDRHAVAQPCNCTDVGWLSSCEDVSPTLLSRMYKDPHLVSFTDLIEYIVRRLTPLECSRLQGFPDWWTDDLEINKPSEDDLKFWREVFETHRKIVTGSKKPKTDKQIIKWLKESHNDGAEYKLWGNGIALPCFLYVVEGIKEVLDRTSNSNPQTAATEKAQNP